MKKLVVTVSLAALFFLGACSATTESKTEMKEAKLNETVVIDGIQFTMKELKTVPSLKVADKKNQEIYGFEVNGKNISYQKSQGFGSSDFVVTTADGKEHTIDESLTYFGDGIEPNQTLKGNVYFSFDKKQKLEKLEYKVNEKVVYSWNIN